MDKAHYASLLRKFAEVCHENNKLRHKFVRTRARLRSVHQQRNSSENKRLADENKRLYRDLETRIAATDKLIDERDLCREDRDFIEEKLTAENNRLKATIEAQQRQIRALSLRGAHGGIGT